MRDRDKIVFSENFKLLLDSFLFISRYEDTLIKLPSTWSSCKSNDSKIGLRPIIFQPEFPPIVSLKGISIYSFWIDLSLHFFFFFVITFFFLSLNTIFYFIFKSRCVVVKLLKRWTYQIRLYKRVLGE